MSVDPGEYPHLKITAEELEALFLADPVILQLKSDIAHFEEKAAKYAPAIAGHRADITKLESEMAELEGRIKALDARIRWTKGLITGARFHEGNTRSSIADRVARIRKRERFIYHREVKNRLTQLGRDLRLDPVRNRIRKNGLDTEHETNI